MLLLDSEGSATGCGGVLSARAMCVCVVCGRDLRATSYII